MSGASRTTIPWQVYDHLRLLLQAEGREDPLPHRMFLVLCREAIQRTQAPVSEQDVWLSVVLRYMQHSGKPTYTLSGNAPDWARMPPNEYELDMLRTIVEALRDERKTAANK